MLKCLAIIRFCRIFAALIGKSFEPEKIEQVLSNILCGCNVQKNVENEA
jgi:hypothetical protein